MAGRTHARTLHHLKDTIGKFRKNKGPAGPGRNFPVFRFPDGRGARRAAGVSPRAGPAARLFILLYSAGRAAVQGRRFLGDHLVDNFVSGVYNKMVGSALDGADEFVSEVYNKMVGSALDGPWSAVPARGSRISSALAARRASRAASSGSVTARGILLYGAGQAHASGTTPRNRGDAKNWTPGVGRCSEIVDKSTGVGSMV